MEEPEVKVQGSEEKMRSAEAEAGSIDNTFKIQGKDVVASSSGGPRAKVRTQH